MQARQMNSGFGRTVLVCGAGGFIGANVAEVFAKHGWRVVGVIRSPRTTGAENDVATETFVGDLANHDFTSEIVSKIRPNRVVFVAGPSNVQASFAQPSVDFGLHMQPLLSVLEAIRLNARGARLILVSSAAVYGEPDKLPVWEGSTNRPISPYGFHKLHQELLIREYGALHGVEACAARVFSTYGPGLRRLAVWEIAQRAMVGNYKVMGDASDSRDFLHVYDVARAIEAICRAETLPWNEVNIASGLETSIDALVGLIYEALGVPIKCQFEGIRGVGNPTRWCADTSRLGALRYQPIIRLSDGIADVINWMKRDA